MALKPVNTKRSSASVPVRWDHLPHDELALEINSRISHRQAHLTDLEVAQKYLRERRKLLILPEHDDYINCVAADLKRELRICRDVYRDYLKVINKKSATAKAGVALDFAVAPMAIKRLREEINIYVRSVGVDDLMFAVLFYRLADRLVMHPHFIPECLELGNVVRSLVPDTCFQELKEATSREIGTLATGPFAILPSLSSAWLLAWKGMHLNGYRMRSGIIATRFLATSFGDSGISYFTKSVTSMQRSIARSTATLHSRLSRSIHSTGWPAECSTR